MVLDIPGKILGQSDVRETPVSVVGTTYWTCTGSNFLSFNPDTDPISYIEGKVTADGNGISFQAPVFLPHGATITAIIVYGDAAASAELFALSRVTLSNLTNYEMATANINSQDTSIEVPIVDNTLYAYEIITGSLDTGDEIYGARITYTI